MKATHRVAFCFIFFVNDIGLCASFIGMNIKEYVAERKAEIRSIIATKDHVPSLCIISVGGNPASEAYIKGKKKDSAEVGFNAVHIALKEETTQTELDALIIEKNNDPSIDGILVQLPLPKHLSPERVNELISPAKDVDGFVPNSRFVCCTPQGIVDYLAHEGFPFVGKNAVVLGRSQIVGKPMAKLLLDRSCNVTVLHSKTSEEDKRFYLKHADLIVVAVGRCGVIDSSYELKPSAFVVDVGINRDEEGHLHGDCEPNLPVALQTPVPGGVGLLTRLALLDNLLEAAK